MVRLASKSGDRLAVWCVATWDSYYQSLRDAGFTHTEAEANVERNKNALFHDGRPNNDQVICDVLDGEEPVGTLWLAERVEDGSSWFVYDIEIDEAFRGRGLGRAAMKAAEDFVIARGGTSLSLNVFGHNSIARHLYQSLGYQEMAITMRKFLG
jgi:ribosomal protein S18 acetylase RimI-like enzyme